MQIVLIEIEGEKVHRTILSCLAAASVTAMIAVLTFGFLHNIISAIFAGITVFFGIGCMIISARFYPLAERI